MRTYTVRAGFVGLLVGVLYAPAEAQVAPPVGGERYPLAPAIQRGEGVAPFFDGFYINEDGTYTYSFGFMNRNTEEIVEIPIGENNFLTPSEFNGMQPTYFPPVDYPGFGGRRERGTFAVRVPATLAEDVVWTLTHNGKTYAVPARTGSATGARGFETRVVPLTYISAVEMEKVLLPYARPNAIVNVDPGRNVITVAGSRQELQNYLRTIEIFDVDWLSGMSVGVFPLVAGRAPDVVASLETVFGEGSNSPVSGMFRFMPLEGANAILVITPQPAYLDQIEQWISRIDGAGGGVQLFSYELKYVTAKDLAERLSEVYGSGGGAGGGRRGGASLMPGLEPTGIGDDGFDSGMDGGGGRGRPHAGDRRRGVHRPRRRTGRRGSDPLRVARGSRRQDHRGHDRARRGRHVLSAAPRRPSSRKSGLDPQPEVSVGCENYQRLRKSIDLNLRFSRCRGGLRPW